MVPGGGATPPQSCAIPREGNTAVVRSPSGDGASPSVQVEKTNPLNVMPDIRNAPQAGQSHPLGQEREVSSIPVGRESTPGHQPQGAEESRERRWVYPSEQMFFNAMRRKGWDPIERDMAAVVKIHNAVNERVWREIMEWEDRHRGACADGPRLKRFLGRPNYYSPKARLLNLLGYHLPFDRHDWFVDRCGEEVRYVIDFYSGPAAPGGVPSMHLDVRPALDSPGALLDRIAMQVRWVWSGRWRGA